MGELGAEMMSAAAEPVLLPPSLDGAPAPPLILPAPTAAPPPLLLHPSAPPSLLSVPHASAKLPVRLCWVVWERRIGNGGRLSAVPCGGGCACCRKLRCRGSGGAGGGALRDPTGAMPPMPPRLGARRGQGWGAPPLMFAPLRLPARLLGRLPAWLLARCSGAWPPGLLLLGCGCQLLMCAKCWPVTYLHRWGSARSSEGQVCCAGTSGEQDLLTCGNCTIVAPKNILQPIQRLKHALRVQSCAPVLCAVALQVRGRLGRQPLQQRRIVRVARLRRVAPCGGLQNLLPLVAARAARHQGSLL